MANELKEEKIKSLSGKFQESVSAVLIDYRGLTVNEMTDLRTQLRSENLEMFVVKNSLAKIASDGTPLQSVKDIISGPTSITLSYKEHTAPAKVLVDFMKKSPKIKIKGGVVEGKALTAEDVKILSDLPSKEVLLGQALATMNGPATNFVGVLAGLMRQVLYVLKAIESKKS